MKLSELVHGLAETLEGHGDMEVYIGDMVPLEDAIIQVVSGNDVMEPKKYGERYLSITE